MASGVEENTKRGREMRWKPHECICSTGRNDNRRKGKSINASIPPISGTPFYNVRNVKSY